MAEIVLDDVSKEYADGTIAVSDLNLDIEDGEFVVLVGPSGCGKTTALRMVAGLECISRRHDLDRRPRGQRRAAEGARHRDGVPELRAVSAHDRVRQHGVRPEAPEARRRRRSTGGSERRRTSSGSRSCSQRKPKALSGGQRQRVAMGRAIVREPKAFLMDEPLSNLDAKLRVQMRTEIARIQHELHVTTIYVTHDQVEAMTMGDRVAVISKGVLQQVDAPQRLYDHPDEPLRRRVHRVARHEHGRGDPVPLERIAGGRVRRVHASCPPRRCSRARPALEAYEGQGGRARLRPEDIEDASLGPTHPADRRIRPSSTSGSPWARTCSSTSWCARPPWSPRTRRSSPTTSGRRRWRPSSTAPASGSRTSWPG